MKDQDDRHADTDADSKVQGLIKEQPCSRKAGTTRLLGSFMGRQDANLGMEGFFR